MKIIIDADGCPVTKNAVEAARQFNVECIIVCDESRVFDLDGSVTITVANGHNSAGYTIVRLAERGDIVITGDVGLVAMCDAKGAMTFNYN